VVDLVSGSVIRRPATDPVGMVLGEVPMPRRMTGEYIRLALRAVLVHTVEEWPDRSICRNDRAPHPCRVARWGRRVLRRTGLTDAAIDALVAAGGGKTYAGRRPCSAGGFDKRGGDR
jgi:hypothetical protein